jgi:hypothetical protein
MYSRIECMVFMTLSVRFIAGLFDVTRRLQFENVRYETRSAAPLHQGLTQAEAQSRLSSSLEHTPRKTAIISIVWSDNAFIISQGVQKVTDARQRTNQ